MKKMVSRRKTLQSRVSLSSSEQEAQLDKEPKTQPKLQQPRIDSLRRFPLRQSTSKKVKEFLQCLQTPSQPARRSSQIPMSSSASKMQEVSSEKCPRGSPEVKITQVTDWKDFICKRLFQGDGNEDENPEPKEHEELSEVQPDKTLSTQSGAVKVSEKTSLRESQPDTGSVKTPQRRDSSGRWLPKVTSAKASSTKGERDRNPKGSDVKCKVNGKSSLVKQTEEPVTELERMKGQQNHVQRKSLRLAKLRSSTEKACSLDHIEQHRLGSNSIKAAQEQDVGIMTPKASCVDKEMQTMTSKFVAMTPKTEDLDMQFAEEPSPKEWQMDAIKESPPFEQAYGNLGNGTEFGEVMPGKREEQAAGREAECSEVPLGPESHEDSMACSESLPLGSEGGKPSSASMGVSGEEEPALPPKVAAPGRGLSEPPCETLHGAAGDREGAMECTGESETVRADTAPGSEPDRSGAMGKGVLLAPPSKPPSGRGQAAPASPSGSQASEIEAARPNHLGSTSLETAGKGVHVAESDAGGAGLPRSFISEPGPERTSLPGSTVSEPDAGGAKLSGSFMSETEAMETNLPESSISESNGGTNLPESSILESNGGTDLKSKCAPSLKLWPRYEPGMANVEEQCTPLQEPESQYVTATPSEHHLEALGESLPLPLGRLHDRESKADFKPSETLNTVREELSEALKTSEGSVALRSAHHLPLADSGSAISDGAAAREPPADSALVVQAEHPDANTALRLEEAQGELACIPPREQAIQASSKSAGLMHSANQEGLTDLATQKHSRRRRRRRRRRGVQKTNSLVQEGSEMRSSVVSANVTISVGGERAGEVAVPVPSIDTLQSLAVYEVKELSGEGPRTDRASDTKLETVKIIVDCNQTERAVELEQDASAEGQRVGEGSTREVMRGKPESDESFGGGLDVHTDLNFKVEIPEASEEDKGVIGQVEAATANLHQEAEAQQMEKWKETPKSAKLLWFSSLSPRLRKRGIVTFLSGKDASQALKYNGEELFGRALRIRRPLQILRPVAIVKGRKRKLKDADREFLIPAKKKKVRKATILTKKNKKEQELLIKRRKKKQEQKAEKMEEEEALAHQKMKKRHWEITASTEQHGEGAEDATETSLCLLKKRRHGKSSSEGCKGDELEDKLFEKEKKQSTERPAFSENTDGDAASLPPKKKKKKRKNAEEKVFLIDKRAEEEKEEEKVASVLQKKKKESKKQLTLSEKTAVEEHATSAKTKKRKKTQEKTSWCLYIQKLRSQNSPCELKAAIADFLSERSVPYKAIQLDPDSCSACVELNHEGDLNEALQFDTCNILGQVARLSKVEKLGALNGRIDSRTLRVKTLPSDVCAKDLKRLFEKVAGVWICQNVNERFGLVMFETEEDKANALSKGEIECRGNLLRLDRAYPVKQASTRSLFVWRLSKRTTVEMLKSTFKEAVGARISRKKGRRFAFVDFKTVEEATRARAQFQNMEIDGQRMKLYFANSVQ
ncbi:hypothetical protein chiPu_0017162 [Chiloscyllium punctatum]|uniref:RRM domain-containing protein n=1 Tax=Chiloscyllium punctatum TaxID=137246 RepID=A0A401T7S0_CHIPU|nr:hypothetical protein [Chiloscyllium punctatum]